MKLNPVSIASLMVERGIAPAASEEPGPALVVSDVTSELIDASVRMLQLLQVPNDIPTLAPLIEREIFSIACSKANRLRSSDRSRSPRASCSR